MPVRWAETLAGLANWSAMNAPRSATILSASSTAPFIPSAPGVRTISAPYALMSEMRSGVMESGITMTARNPRAAAIIASAMPMFPEVGSTMVPPSSSLPRATASSIIESAALSFTDPLGLDRSGLT